MRDWRKLNKVTVFTGKDKNGNRYLTQFLRDYQKTFNVLEINAGCERCLNEYYSKLILKLNTMSNNKKQDCAYVLKLKYHGIPKTPGSRDLITNENLTNEIGDFLLKNHPRGEMLFDAMPENAGKAKSKSETKSDNVTDTEDLAEEYKNLSLAALKTRFPDVRPATSKAKMLERIAEYKASQDTEDQTQNNEEEE